MVNSWIEIALSDLGIIKATATGEITYTANGETTATTWSTLKTIEAKFALLIKDVSLKRNTKGVNTYTLSIGDTDTTIFLQHTSWASNPLWNVDIKAPVDADDTGICVTGKCVGSYTGTNPPTTATEFTGKTSQSAAEKACAPLLGKPEYNDCLFDVQQNDDDQVGITQAENETKEKKAADFQGHAKCSRHSWRKWFKNGNTGTELGITKTTTIGSLFPNLPWTDTSFPLKKDATVNEIYRLDATTAAAADEQDGDDDEVEGHDDVFRRRIFKNRRLLAELDAEIDIAVEAEAEAEETLLATSANTQVAFMEVATRVAGYVESCQKKVSSCKKAVDDSKDEEKAAEIKYNSCQDDYDAAIDAQKKATKTKNDAELTYDKAKSGKDKEKAQKDRDSARDACKKANEDVEKAKKALDEAKNKKDECKKKREKAEKDEDDAEEELNQNIEKAKREAEELERKQAQAEAWRIEELAKAAAKKAADDKKRKEEAEKNAVKKAQEEAENARKKAEKCQQDAKKKNDAQSKREAERANKRAKTAKEKADFEAARCAKRDAERAKREKDRAAQAATKTAKKYKNSCLRVVRQGVTASLNVAAYGSDMTGYTSVDIQREVYAQCGARDRGDHRRLKHWNKFCRNKKVKINRPNLLEQSSTINMQDQMLMEAQSMAHSRQRIARRAHRMRSMMQ